MGRKIEDWGRFSAIGLWEDGDLIAGFVFNHFNWPDIAIHAAVKPGSNWATKGYLREVFGYVFNQLGCRRVTGSIKDSNEVAKHFAVRLGGRLEGTLRKAHPEGDDILLFGMLKEECRWIRAEFSRQSDKVLPILG
jgi:RimJ/RimL family protein N-acetyltransferase